MNLSPDPKYMSRVISLDVHAVNISLYIQFMSNEPPCVICILSKEIQHGLLRFSVPVNKNDD